jgi:O-antigen ligase
LSGTRGGWLIVPVFILLLIYFRGVKFSFRHALSSVFLTSLTLAFLYGFSASFHQRVSDISNDLILLGEGNKDTSLGVRLQLYFAATDTFMRNPWFGVGPEGFAQEMQPMSEAGQLTPLAATLGRGEVHNDILAKSAGMGVFGLGAMLAIYLIPLMLFWRKTKQANEGCRRSAIMGVIFVSGFIVFGFTVELLNLAMAVAFYSFTVAVFLAVCYNTRCSDSCMSKNKESHV